MPWLERRKRADGSVSWWIRDRRDGIAVVIPGGASESEAKMKLEQYKIRKDLEKEGYEDRCQALVDEMWGKRRKILRKAKYN